MSYMPITDPKLIQKCFRAFRDRFSAGVELPNVLPFGQAGREVRWHRSLGIWTCFGEDWRDNAKGDWFALFGVGKPHRRQVADLEINVYKRDPNRQIDGRYFTDDHGALYIGRTATANQGQGIAVPIVVLKPEWSADLVTIDWKRKRNDTEEVILLGAVNESDFPERVAALVKTVKAIKSGTSLLSIRVPSRAPKAKAKKPPSFDPEFEDDSTYERKASRVVVRHDHAKIVWALKQELDRCGYTALNDDPRDLYIPSTGTYASVLFEIKKANELQATYTAIGQLMFHGARQNNTPIRVLVTPVGAKPKTEAALEKLGIEVVTFTCSHKGKFVFSGLSRVLRLLERKGKRS